MVLQKKSLKIMHFLKRNAHTSNLFKNLNILKLPDKVSLENCILICKYFNQSLPKSFKNWFTPATDSHTHNTRWSNSCCLKIPSHKTKIYGRLDLKAWLKNSIFLIIINTLMSCTMSKSYFAFLQRLPSLEVFCREGCS